jgi:hypothetical protein
MFATMRRGFHLGNMPRSPDGRGREVLHLENLHPSPPDTLSACQGGGSGGVGRAWDKSQARVVLQCSRMARIRGGPCHCEKFCGYCSWPYFWRAPGVSRSISRPGCWLARALTGASAAAGPCRSSRPLQTARDVWTRCCKPPRRARSRPRNARSYQRSSARPAKRWRPRASKSALIALRLSRAASNSNTGAWAKAQPDTTVPSGCTSMSRPYETDSGSQ